MRLPVRKAESNLSPEARALARDYSLEALTVLVRLIAKGKSDTIRLAAAGLILHYANQAPGSDNGRSLIEFFSRIPLDEPPREPGGEV